MAYVYDVFVSYRRRPPVSDWVHNHFVENFLQWLDVELPDGARVFIDEQIETGSEWPEVLRNALASSRLLVPVWSPSYFRSRWCMAELSTMRRREEICGLRTRDDPRGLIFPLKFNDGAFFHPQFTSIQCRDMEPWNTSAPVFKETPRFVDFIDEIKTFARQVAARVPEVPAWDPSWPVLDPGAEEEPVIRLPRL